MSDCTNHIIHSKQNSIVNFSNVHSLIANVAATKAQNLPKEIFTFPIRVLGSSFQSFLEPCMTRITTVVYHKNIFHISTVTSIMWRDPESEMMYRVDPYGHYIVRTEKDLHQRAMKAVFLIHQNEVLERNRQISEKVINHSSLRASLHFLYPKFTHKQVEPAVFIEKKIFFFIFTVIKW